MLSFWRNRINLDDITEFEFVYTTGNMKYARVKYEIKYDNGIYTAIIKPNGVADENAIKGIADARFIKELRDILVANGVSKWNGFKKSNKIACDGRSFYLHLKNGQGQDVTASGYMKWPKNYNEVKKRIDELFGSLAD